MLICWWENMCVSIRQCVVHCQKMIKLSCWVVGICLFWLVLIMAGKSSVYKHMVVSFIRCSFLKMVNSLYLSPMTTRFVRGILLRLRVWLLSCRKVPLWILPRQMLIATTTITFITPQPPTYFSPTIHKQSPSHKTKPN